MRIPINMIRAQDNARQQDDRVIAALMESIAAVGLIQPVTVRQISAKGGTDHAWKLIAGMHRVEACRRLGHEVIDANAVEGRSYLETELIEIDENLCRAELTPAQRAIAIKRRKQIWEALHPEQQVEQIVPPVRKHGHAQEQAFAAETAAVSGQSKQDINRHLSRAEALGDDLAAIAGTSLDKGVELDALKTLPEPERKDLIARAKAGEPVSARKPAARLSLTIEYFDVQDGASSIAYSIIRRDPALARALLAELQTQLKEAA